MREKLESFLVFVSGFVFSIVSIAYYRYQTVFAKLCNQMAEEQLPGPSTNLGAWCLNFEQVLAVTTISPLYFIVSILIEVSVAALFWRKRA